LWTAGGLIIVAALNTRRLLTRYRLSRPVSLALVPKLKRPPATGAFIAFEGVEGAGKGTQIALLEAHLREEDIPVLVTREPGGTATGERIRDLLLDPATGSIDARAEAMLFAAARAQTVASVIRPDLVILLHIEPELGLSRSSGAPDRMEREGGAFLATVANAYLRIAEEHPERFVVIDASREPEAVFDDVRAAIDKALNERHDHEHG
jgi:dTMP kinase